MYAPARHDEVAGPVNYGDQIQETARHAGHADIMRDGVMVPTLELAREGTPANQFFQPCVPAPGTIGSA